MVVKELLDFLLDELASNDIDLNSEIILRFHENKFKIIVKKDISKRNVEITVE